MIYARRGCFAFGFRLGLRRSPHLDIKEMICAMDTTIDTRTVNIEKSRFNLGDEPDAWQAWYDDSAWGEVRLPHDWSVSLAFSKDYSSGTGYLAGGIGWYRIHIDPQDGWRGRRITINFDGIYKNSRVWCNSVYLGERPNGYISFSFDITDCFNFESENIISVYVDRRELSDSRWFTGSGITRKVTLTICEPICPEVNGIFFHTQNVCADHSEYTVESMIANHTDAPCNATVSNLLFSNSSEKCVSRTSSDVTIPPNKSVCVTNTGAIDNPMLWSPENPTLYTLKTFIRYKGESDTQYCQEYCTSTTRVGVRSIRFNADKGFFLNDTPYKLKGVCVHHDAGCLGAAVYAPVWRRRLIKLKEMGCNAIRTSHNPHMPELYSLCDELGFFVMDEAFDEWELPKNKWWQGHNVYPPRNQGYYTNFPVWHKRDLEDMILRDRNHPCVILWSIGNEIDYPNDPYCHPSFGSMTGNNDAQKPESERMYNPKRPNAERLAALSKQLCDIAKSADATRPVTLAAAFPELSAKLGFIDPLDVVGFNYKEHLYAEHHLRFPGKPFLGSENGHTYKAWRAVTDNEYISGQFLWTGIDYLGEARGWPVHGSGAGLLTLAGFEKTGYFRRQSFWSDTPMVHLATVRLDESRTTPWGEVFDDAISCEFSSAGECWNYCKDEPVLVKCYTNLDSIELSLNGESLGIFSKEKDADCICAVTNFKSGELKARGTGEFCGVSHSLYTTMSACQISLKECLCNGSAVSGFHQIEVTMLDENGRRVYNDSTMLNASVENGTLLGLENGDLSDITEYSARYRRAYRGQLMIYAFHGDNAREMLVKVTGEQVKPACLSLTV